MSAERERDRTDCVLSSSTRCLQISTRDAMVPTSMLNLFEISSSRKSSDRELIHEVNRGINPETPGSSTADNWKLLLQECLRGASLTPRCSSYVNSGVQLSLLCFVSTTDWGLSWVIGSRATEWKLLETVLVLEAGLEAECTQIGFLPW